MTTNITEFHMQHFDELQRAFHDGQLALVSCFFDGQPRAALAVVVHREDESYDIGPVALMIEPDQFNKLTNHDGHVPDGKLVGDDLVAE